MLTVRVWPLPSKVPLNGFALVPAIVVTVATLLLSWKHLAEPCVS